ncbi:hypothetical protein BpHYR1_047491 [Brachionus plicatilis]|uniref:Uncharacterized protein n=1 Tax=Brachionus plicatilis TaxID=10195 RepID=A0A3M7QF50_BRAPC|nr:hypothetical protein BpHYR1_047491 [Brachionus plicatilis]
MDNKIKNLSTNQTYMIVHGQLSGKGTRPKSSINIKKNCLAEGSWNFEDNFWNLNKKSVFLGHLQDSIYERFEQFTKFDFQHFRPQLIDW